LRVPDQEVMNKILAYLSEFFFCVPDPLSDIAFL